jgi:hypothetical protein
MTQCGLARLAVSLDGPTAETHDAFRRVAGSYDWILQAKVKVVQELLHHANSRITLDLYAQEGAEQATRTKQTCSHGAQQARSTGLTGSR